MTPTKRMGTAMAAGMLMAASLLGMTGGTATAAENDLSEVQATVASVMGADVAAQGRRVDANTLDYGGFTATKNANLKLTCRYGYLCMEVRGTVFNYYKCQTWTVSNWYGTGPWINNQTPGTVARFYGKSGNQLWTSTAYSDGTADWAPVYSLRPC
ncbi:hypothetical protein GCM10010329_17890 [Streptomyces spiroverticillatus]|uniref:Secreted protein n=1 Tax=Streptomyces finlayi TaxID=67296 RepID=A0A918WUB4_9ACTN|nr:hypothetical protein [Streptomyces finlayi]GGZ97049.1 hypothetical protein GCM10010329_17890 [Streptomyces spiroverticillatus]GHC82275.1 hypothetical protein GCM10010334_10370 [Streptomyces finlayi]